VASDKNKNAVARIRFLFITTPPYFRCPEAITCLTAIAEYTLNASVFRERSDTTSYDYQNKKAEHAKGFSFGSSAIFLKTRRFPRPSRKGIGFVGK
jgi:hypothetical protein